MYAYDVSADSISGSWHLLDASASGQGAADRIDLRLVARDGLLRGTATHRSTGDEMMLASAMFDGSTLRVRMMAPPSRRQADMPWLVMTAIGPRFEGHWRNQDGETVGPKLKMIRAIVS